MLTSRRFKGTLLLVGLLTVGLGLYVGLQFNEVAADIPTTVVCGLNKHTNFATSGINRTLVGVESNTEACPYCRSQAYVTWSIYELAEYSGYDTWHTPPNRSDWNLCHGHHYVLWTWEDVRLKNVDCSNPNCGG